MARSIFSPLKDTGACFIEAGYGQVEPNLLSAQRTGQIYAQLPAAEAIEVLENGQFAKYDYATNGGEVNFTGAGEWMLVYNEVKVYRDLQRDCDFAMLKGNYEARVYSPITGGYEKVQKTDAQGRPLYLDGEGEETIDAEGNTPIMVDGIAGPNWTSAVAAADPYEIDSTNDPMKNYVFAGPAMMGGKTMVPRLLKTNVGDIFTTNTIAANTVEVGNILAPNANGYLAVVASSVEGMKWQVVKVYTMPDGQPGAKIMRIA